MVVPRYAHTSKSNQEALSGTKTAPAAFPTRRFMHAYFDVPSSQADTDDSDLIDSAGADQTPAKSSTSSDGSVPVNCQSPIQGQHRQQTRGASLITEITLSYVQQLLAELKQERAARQCASRENEALREEVECLKKDKSHLESDLDQSQLERSVLEADLMFLRDQEMPELLEENEDLKDKCESLTCQLDNAYNEIRALACHTPTPASSVTLESDNGMEDGDLQSAEIAELRFDCDDSRQRITVLERQVYVLAEKLEHTHGRLDRVNKDTLRSTLHEVAVAPAMAESVCDQMRRQSNLDDERSGLATPSESGRFKVFFYPGLEHSEPLQPETSAATLTPPPTPLQPVFPISYTGDTLVCLEAETATAKAPAKAVTATKAGAKKAAKSIRKAASAMAHMRFHH